MSVTLVDHYSCRKMYTQYISSYLTYLHIWYTYTYFGLVKFRHTYITCQGLLLMIQSNQKKTPTFDGEITFGSNFSFQLTKINCYSLCYMIFIENITLSNKQISQNSKNFLEFYLLLFALRVSILPSPGTILEIAQNVLSGDSGNNLISSDE